MTLLDTPDMLFSIIESTQKPILAAGLTAGSLILTLLYLFTLDVKHSFIDPPKHFPKWRWSEMFFKPKINAPLVKLKPGSKDYEEVLERGSRQYPDRPFRIQHHPYEWVIVPYKMIDEVILRVPEAKLSFQQGSYDFFASQHTGITNHEKAVAVMLRTGINHIIDTVQGVVEDEASRTVRENIGECSDWTTIQMLPKTINMIMTISQRVFVGEPLCRDPKWIYCIYQVTQPAFASIHDMWLYNDFTRPFAAWRHAGLRSVREHREKAKAMLKPILEQRLKDMESPSFKPAPDLMQFILDATAKTGEGRSLDYQVNAIIGTGRAALFTTGFVLFELLYDLAVHSEYIEPLREEIRWLGDVPHTRPNVAKLVKLDSFIRESHRHSQLALVGTLRKVVRDITLSDGTLLPSGTYVGTHTHNAVFDNSTLRNPYQFDGLRFARIREQHGKENMYQAVQTSADHLFFGHGNQACPGRFFAVHELKVLLSHILMGYDFKIKKMPKTHPLAHFKGFMTEPDRNVEFEFKRRTERTM